MTTQPKHIPALILALMVGLACWGVTPVAASAQTLDPIRPARVVGDPQGPAITGVRVVDITSRSATLTWTTDVAGSSIAGYVATDAPTGTITPLDPTLTRSHRIAVAGLNAGVTYHFQVGSYSTTGALGVSDPSKFTTATSDFAPGNLGTTVPVPSGLGLDDASSPDHVVGDGSPSSCTSAAVVAAVTAGGVVTFDCGPDPITITLSQTLKVGNSTARLLLDGGGLVTLSGAGSRRILYIDTCDGSLGAVSGNCLYAPTGPQVTVQNLTFADGNASNASYVSPGDRDLGSNGGGAIFDLGGRLKVVRSVFVRNVCASNGPDLGGGAIRVLAQHSDTPNDLDASFAARNQHPVTIVQSTFGGAAGRGNACSNGGAVSGLRTPITIINSLITHNEAIGCCSNPAKSGTPGGGSGGAVYTDGTSYTLSIAGSDLELNTAKAGGSSIFYVSNDRTGHLIIDTSVSKLNSYVSSGQPTDQHFQNYPGIFYLGDGAPRFVNSTIA